MKLGVALEVEKARVGATNKQDNNSKQQFPKLYYGYNLQTK